MLFEIDGPTAVIRFNRPDKLNACTREMGAALIELIDRAESQQAVRCIVITGNGRAFCAGADLSASKGTFAAAADTQAEPFRDFGGIITLRLYDCVKPVIVAFNGPAAGMGVTLALAADIRIASDTAKFVLPFVRRGIVPESASSWFLPRIVGLPRAMEWMLRGATVDASEALAAGLVSAVHPESALIPAAFALAEEIATHTAPVSVALTRRLLWRMAGAPDPHAAHAIESRLLHERMRSSDIREGAKSFLDKRLPEFPDRLDDGLPALDW
ncbi:enoyl-CoA hydratase-related protein [Croceicoccus mobilis]|uniref:Enoyl-CoA hydratase n=1 Tax=Croceicoccus mobilis TaxID=1703339 RepID=A0A916Z7Y6_9SPHN|nr:enoyl-CoA hydratase-related protein [Croceicoccus mobilis]GGD80309.1 enoyl-CoA hydratase [Croceicoccus mobilis]